MPTKNSRAHLNSKFVSPKEGREDKAQSNTKNQQTALESNSAWEHISPYYGTKETSQPGVDFQLPSDKGGVHLKTEFRGANGLVK